MARVRSQMKGVLARLYEVLAPSSHGTGTWASVVTANLLVMARHVLT